MESSNLKVMKLEKPFRIGTLAKRTSKTTRALHLYEELGLLRPIQRSKGGFRLYSPAAVERVQWIAKLQEAGLSLHQLQDLLRGVTEDVRAGTIAMARLRTVFAERLTDTRIQIDRLTRVEKELEASIAYLDGCRTCETSYEIEDCGSCDHNGHHDGEQPMLVAGIHRG